MTEDGSEKKNEKKDGDAPEKNEEQVSADLKKLVFAGRLTDRVDWLNHKVELQVITSREQSLIEQHERIRAFGIEERRLGSEGLSIEGFKLTLSYAIRSIDSVANEDRNAILERLDGHTATQILLLMAEYTKLVNREATALSPEKLSEQVKN